MATIDRQLTRRGLIRISTLLAGAALAACAAPAAPTAPPATEAPKTSAPAPVKEAPAAPKDAAAPGPTKPAAAAPAPAAKDAVTIRVSYRIGDKPEVYERLFPQFMQQNPNIKLVGEPISYGAYEEYFAKLASMMAGDTNKPSNEN